VDLSTQEADEHFHLLKKLKRKDRSGGQGKDAWTETEIEFEIHDPQAALVHLGRHHKLFTDGVEVSGPNGGPIPFTLQSALDHVYDDGDNSNDNTAEPE
jgi:hypothetical protein